MKFIPILFLVFLTGFVFSQQNTVPISSFYKDQLYRTQDKSDNVRIHYSGSSFLPASEGSYNLHEYIRDSSVQYYDFTEYIFKKHLIEVKGNGYYLTVSPILNMGIGKDFEDSIPRRLFNNTRGILVEVDIMKNFSFMTSLYENQNRFTKYESAYYTSIGERYPQADSLYSPQNAIVPGAARTKPFKNDGFDYAYAIGNMVYSPNKHMRFMAGNNSQFVGMGYRSLFLSDNSVPAVYLRGDFTFLNKFKYTFLRSKQFNVFRRPNFTTVEAYYEPKLFSTQYLEYPITDKLSVGLFEGSYWNVGDSVTSKPVNGAYYIPIPFVGGAIVNDLNEVNSLAGLQASYHLNRDIRFYGQLAISNWNTNSIGSQIGVRYYDVAGLKNSMLQLEYNNVPKRLYQADNSRLSYSAYNLPSAHPKGNGFQEIVLRMNYSKKRVYGDCKLVYYQLKGYQEGSLLIDENFDNQLSDDITHLQIELGYRMNKRMNFELFTQFIHRDGFTIQPNITNAVMAGIRTGLRNNYKDF